MSNMSSTGQARRSRQRTPIVDGSPGSHAKKMVRLMQPVRGQLFQRQHVQQSGQWSSRRPAPNSVIKGCARSPLPVMGPTLSEASGAALPRCVKRERNVLLRLRGPGRRARGLPAPVPGSVGDGLNCSCRTAASSICIGIQQNPL